MNTYINKNCFVNAEYKRDMDHIYLVFPDGENTELLGMEDYQYEMLQNNMIDGLLPVSRQIINGSGSYQYDVSSRESIRKYYETREMGYREILNLILSLHIALQSMKEYLLDENNILLNPEYIFFHMETEEIRFIFYPPGQQMFSKSLHTLSEFLLSKTDHNDEKAVEIVYRLFKETASENFTMKSMISFIEQLDQKGVPERMPHMMYSYTESLVEPQAFPDEGSVLTDGYNIPERSEREEEEQEQRDRERWTKIIVILCSAGILGMLLYVYGLQNTPKLWTYIITITSLATILVILFQRIAEKRETSRQK